MLQDSEIVSVFMIHLPSPSMKVPFDKGRCMKRSEDDAPDRETKWKGWGVNPNTNTHDGDVSDSDHSTVEQHEWKGWGVNP